jgi:hypothetical protein
LAEIAFFKRELATDRAVDSLWVIEDDVAWTGGLRAALDAYDNETHDLLCFDPSRVQYMKRHFWEKEDRWMHSRTHSGDIHKSERRC